METYFVKKIEEVDVKQVVGIIHRAWHWTHDHYHLKDFPYSGLYETEQTLKKHVNSPHVWYGAYHHSRLIGVICMENVSRQTKRLKKLAVDADFQHMGVAKKLIKHFECDAFAMGARKIEMVYLKNNHLLNAFYLSLGYEITKQVPYKKSDFILAYAQKKINHLVDLVPHDSYGLCPLESVGMDRCKDLVSFHLVYHPEEVMKATNTGHLVQRVLPNITSEWIWHRHQLEILSDQLMPDAHHVLVYPDPEAMTLNAFLDERHCDQKVQFVLLDATWQQAQKMINRSHGFKSLKRVRLETSEKSIFTLRRNQRDEGVCTLEACALILKTFGFDQVSDDLLETLKKWIMHHAS